ncbi:scarecrow-like protein 1 isoform X2 [Macadamia integrifolia]|uniref:scarecrow-like protein 1 isoform X2 n=1 Tax=Macadamia integrifolia TaxID=60698 RepID=UPI001C4EA1F2|nr:scarecrow-like protein 1 isoform X2 [Macadamia integrifolia]
MSLVKPADPSASSYGRSQLYMLNGSSDSTRLSSQAFSSDKRKFMYGPESYCRESYNQQYYTGSPADDFHASRIEFRHPSSTDVPRSLFSPQATGNPGGSQSQSSSEYLYEQSLENGTVDYEDDDIRFKLQELERVLLNDNDDDDTFILDQCMDIDGEWADPIKNLILPNSPKESSSSDSNLSCISSNKEISPLNYVSSSNMSRTASAKQLLFECAAAIAEGNKEEASAMITELRQMVSIQGDPAHRIAAYMVEGLAARLAASGKCLYKALKCKEPPTLDRLSAMQILFEVCPCFKFGFIAANGAIAEALEGEERVHIIDFDVNQGSQYIPLIQAVAARSGKPPHVRVTGVDDPESVQHTVGGLKIVGQRLEQFAEAVGVPFEFQAVPVNTVDITPAMLDCRPSEALVVNFAFQLHHMPDESVSTVNQRDRLLRMVKSLHPRLVTVVEQDVNTNTAPFFPRFVEAYNYYSAVFESLDATLPRESPDRINVEKQCLAREIVNIVACEGEERIERYEVAGKWRARMMMAGFQSCPLSAYVNDTIRKLRKQYCDRYKVKEEGGALHFGWEEKILVVASAWK